MKRTAFLNIGELVTMAGPPGPRLGRDLREIGLLSRAGLLADQASPPRVIAVGPSSEIQSQATPQDDIVDCGGRVVTPGYIDSHTHSCFAGTRADEWERRAGGATYQEIAAQGGGILSTVRATRDASEDDLVAQTERHLAWNQGVVAFEVKSGYGLDGESELKMLRAARQALGSRPCVLTFLGAHAVPPEAPSRREYLELVIDQMLPAAARLATCADMFVEEGYFTPEDCRRYAAAVKKLGLKLRLHVDQMGDQGGAALAAELGAVSADHLEHTSEHGMMALAQAGVFAGLLPGSVFGLRSKIYPDARKMIDLGVPVSVATDFNPGSSPVPSIPFCMRLAVDAMGMTAAEALAAATINAAHNLGLGRDYGSLEPGKVAALLMHDVGSYREIPYWVGISTIRS